MSVKQHTKVGNFSIAEKFVVLFIIYLVHVESNNTPATIFDLL